ncbi:TPA: tape measure protein [Pseudomonas aeruginosa]|nr:tape measure protein [Pseudomonas aeruginosa]
MSDRNLELALRLKVDLEAGRRSIQQLSADVEQVGDKSADTGKKITEVSEAASSAATKTASANDALTASESRLAAAIRNANDELAARDRMASKPVAPAALALPTPSTRPAPTPALAPENTAALVELNRAAESVAVTSKEAATQLGRIGESAEQQATRIKAMVSASLQQQAAIDAVATETTRAAGASERANSTWRETAAAQSAAMNAHHNVERQLRETAAAEAAAAQEAVKAAADSDKQDASLRRLLGTLDRTERELAQLDAQQKELSTHFKAGRLDAEAYAAGLAKIEARRNALTGISNDANRANRELSGLAAGIRRVQSLLMTGIAGYGLTSASRAIVNTNVEWQQAVHTMEAATGSAAAARKELEFVREVSERLGLELLSSSQAYARLVAAAKESPELGKQIQGVFEGVSAAATTLHLSREQVNGLLLALEQMVSKGKVQTQELVLQLGQRVPGAFALAAKALDTNTAQLSQWLEKGMIPATEFLPRFGEALQEAYGNQAQKAANGLQGELNRLTNAFTDLKIQAGESGFIDSYTTAVRDLQEVLKDPAVIEGLNTLITALGKLIEFGAKGIGGAAAVVKYVGEEIASRVNGPSGDDPVRLEEAIERETLWMEKAQARLDAAYEKGNQTLAASIEAGMSETQANLARWQQMLDEFYAPKPALELPATTVNAPTGNRPAFTPAGGEDKDAARRAKSNADWVAQLEKEAATFGKSKAALREYELDQRKLSGTLEDRARAAWATLDAAEKQKKADAQAAKDSKLLVQLQLDYLRATGQGVEAAGAEIEKKYGALQKRLIESGNTEGAGLVTQLMGVERAKAELDELEQQLERIFGEQSRREQTINTQQQAGLISEIGARQQILDLNKLTADQIEQLLPKMRELAAATGDPAALERLRDLEVRLQGLRTVANEFANALKSGVETGLQNALQGLATGTMDLQEAALSFVNSIASSMASLASQQLAQMASSKLMGMFGGGDDGAGLAVGASAVTASAGALSAAGGTLITGAAAIQAAAASLAAASTTQAVSGAASYTGAFGFASGGQVLGPGTGTSDSIRAWLSNEEVVIRAAVATQAGMTPLLLDINQRGWAAVHDWSSGVRHSTGGLAGVPAPALPAPTMPSSGRLAEPAASMGATLKNSQNFYLVDDPARIGNVMSGPIGQDAIVIAMSRDPAKFRSILNINGN